MIQALNSEVDGDTSASWFYRGDLDKMERFVDRADALVLLSRPILPRLHAWWPAQTPEVSLFCSMSMIWCSTLITFTFLWIRSTRTHPTK